MTKGAKERASGQQARGAKKRASGQQAKVARKPTARTLAKRLVRKAATPLERRVVRTRDLDPTRRCGTGTSVERLIRVDELVDRQQRVHLVYLDRHGWYCEHGRGCPAVGHARKHARLPR